MGSVLPTVIIVLAEVIVILLIALGVMLYLHLRKSKRHQHEMDALMGIARHAEQTPPPQDAHVAEPVPMPSTYPTSPAAGTDTEFASRTNQSIIEIREAIARLDAKLGQFHHEDKLHDKDLDHKIAEENTQIQVVRKELHDITTAMHELKMQHATLDQDLHNLRVEIEQHALHEVPVRAAPAKNEAPKKETYKYVTPPAKPAPHHDPTLIDDFTLPDSVLEELEEVAKSDPSDTHAAAHAPPHPPVAKPAVAVAQKSAQDDKSEGNGSVKKGTVEEPQYAFNASEIKDMFNVPLFIPGAANAGINVEELDFEGLNLEHPHGAAGAIHEQPHYDAERVFYQSAEQSGIKTGWYFTLRGGKTHGPFGSKEAGARVLNEMIEQFKRTGDTGGR